MAIKNP